MPLADYCAYWFVRKQLGVPADLMPQEDGSLAEAEKKTLTTSLADSINEAQLRVWPELVLVDASKLETGLGPVTTLFGARDAVLGAAFSPGGASVKTPDGFSDYIVTRWLWHLMFKSDIRVRPLDVPMPNNYGKQEIRLLFEAMNDVIDRSGLTVTKSAVESEMAKWKNTADIRKSYLKNTK